MRILYTILIAALAIPFSATAQDPPPQRAQFPSPMVENTRRHDRIPQAEYPGVHLILEDVLPKPVDIYIARRSLDVGSLDLVFYFHGAPFITHHAAESSGVDFVGVTVQLGGGSSAYNASFVDSTAFLDLVEAIRKELEDEGIKRNFGRTILAGFSAGYGAVRRILSWPHNREMVDAALLLDGIHASYVPDRTVLAEGGSIETGHLEIFLSFAQEAAEGRTGKRFVITHSEVFPGTFVSTTEATDWIIEQMGLKRTPVLSWGPLGMQQVSDMRAGYFSILGFAGNSGVDHGDHLHAFGDFLRLVAWGDRPEH